MWTAHLKETAAHIALMASLPGFVDHARWRMKELMREPLYAGLRELVQAEMEKAKK